MGIPRERSLGRYELLIELARGGMAELFLARLSGAGGFEKLVAIKRILPHLAQDPQFTELFLNEGRIAAQLSHPNVCQVFELGEAGGELFLAMEYLDGVAWEQLSAAAPREVALGLTAGVIGQAAEGLHYAHALHDAAGRATPVVHRDVSPQNLFVTVDGVCKVLDFGVAKMMRDGPRTRSGVIKGKLPYMAPKQIRGEPVDARADVFSLGVCAWESFTGARLFDREADYQIWKAITEEEVPPIASRWPACPPLVDAVVRRALARERDQRQRSARGFAEELKNAAGGAASPAEIAELLRVWCGARIAARQSEIAAARGASGGASRASTSPVAFEPTLAGETASMLMRRDSIAVRREDAGSGGRMVAEEEAAETRDFARSSAGAGGGAGAPAPNRHAPGPEGNRNRSRSRSHLVTAIVAAGVAAVVTAVVVVVVTRGGAPAPVASAPPDAAEAAEAAEPSEPSELEGLETGMRTLEQLGTLREDLTALRDRLAPLARARTQPGTYVIDSEPPATIYVDGKLLGETPLRAPLPAGIRAIRAVLADGRERSFAVKISPGHETRAEPLTW